ncbi:peptidoglycan-binding protein, partial [Streptomyces sp. NPDC093094]|uniref:peptidoglycan-binding domain-containing protein n=1 Tax=Streptomyces sp. NPDC093094 TaxID=3366026 RepID=UPI0037FE3022
PVTDTHVREFQHRAGIVVDGIVGPQTWAALRGGGGTGASAGQRTLSTGSRGAAVRELQQLLNMRLPHMEPLVVDGDFGPVTDTHVREFQHRAGIVVDGIVGPQTWAALRG